MGSKKNANRERRARAISTNINIDIVLWFCETSFLCDSYLNRIQNQLFSSGVFKIYFVIFTVTIAREQKPTPI